MASELVAAIREQTVVLFTNADICLQTCNPAFVLCDMPVWKHVYHMLHSLDQWYINPNEYAEPDFHEPLLNSLDHESKKTLTKTELSAYLETIRAKILAYLDSLTDDMLCDLPKGCTRNRLSLILAQYRHFYAHLGNINATTIVETGKWPRVIGTTGKSGASTDGLYE